MADKKNCWEVMGCRRGPDGTNGDICPAFKAVPLNGVHDGLNGGRACWVVAGTMCNGETSGSFAKKMEDCLACPFYRRVRKEEPELKSHQDLLIRNRRN